jgi:hypothetical protein
MSSYQWAGQFSQFITTRDHITGDLYIRLAANQQQHRINVPKQTSSGSSIRVIHADVAIPAFEYATELTF